MQFHTGLNTVLSVENVQCWLVIHVHQVLEKLNNFVVQKKVGTKYLFRLGLKFWKSLSSVIPVLELKMFVDYIGYSSGSNTFTIPPLSAYIYIDP